MALLEEITARLSSQSVGATSSGATWRIVFRDFLPGTIGGTTQAQQICVTPTGGFPSLMKQVGGATEEELSYPTFQVRVRASSTGSTGLEQKVTDVITHLHEMGPRTLSGTYWVDCRMEGEPLWLGRDENQRPVYALNFTGSRSRTT